MSSNIFLNDIFIMALNILELLEAVMGVLHTFVRFLPLGLYSFAYLTAALFKDRRGAIILGGLILNDFAGFSFKKYFDYTPNKNCAIFGGKEGGDSLGFLPNTHTEMISSLTAFIYSNMWDEYKFDLIPFVMLFLLVLLVGWSRVSLGCKELKDVIFNIIVGGVLGMLYYFLVKDSYVKAKEDATGIGGNKACDLGYNNYKCNEIQNGTVIIKNPPESNKKKKEEEESDESQGWYDSS
jgi:hypothetical protein